MNPCTARTAATPSPGVAAAADRGCARHAGIDITGEQPKILTYEDAEACSVVITMGCGDVCPVFPGQRHWKINDPAGQDLGTVRRIRDDIRARVEQLITELTVTRG